MTEHKRLVENIQTKMAFYVSNLRISNDRDYFDENKEAEYFFCKPLSLLFDANVTNANTEQRNFPGIDLADRKESISFQITSTNTKKKVQHTLDEFLEHNLDDDFDRLIVLIVTLDTPPKCANLRFDRPFGFDVKRDVWNVSRLVQEFADLPADKRHLLQTFSDYLDLEIPSMAARKPHLELPPCSVLQASGFVGRESELEKIRSRFAQGDQLVVLTGLGGIGKTELAIRYGLEHSGKVYFTRFDTTFTRTIANMALGIRPALSDEQLRQDESSLSAMVMELLEDCGKADLLIIDNADSETGTLADLQRDPGYAALLRLPLKLLLTTRSDASRAIPVASMPDAALIRIFRNHNAQLTGQEMTDLIRAVNSHTMTIDLIARTLNGKRWRKVSAADVLTALKENTLARQEYRKIATDYSQSPEQAQIYAHLSVVFNVSGVPEDSKAVLSCATLLPDGGMDAECFGNSLEEDGQNALDALLDRGWLEIKNDLLTIHPVIRLVCQTEIPPTDERCDAFLSGLAAQYDETNYRKDRYRQMAELLANAYRLLTDTYGNCAVSIGLLWRELGDFGQALDYSLRAMKRAEETLSPNHPDLARIYYSVGITYRDLGDYTTALEYLEKVLEIRKKALPPDHPDLAASYNNVGLTYDNLGDHAAALEYHRKALEIHEKALTPDHLSLATSYNNVGATYGYLGDHATALEYLEKALEIHKKALPQDHPDLASSYCNVGATYGSLGDYKAALKYQELALAIHEKVLPQDHPRLANSYHNVGFAYGSLGNHAAALEYLEKALEIHKKALPHDHPDLAASYSNMGHTYGELGDHQTALKYHKIALEIRQKALPHDHPNLAQSYNNVGTAYVDLGDQRTALDYLKKALDIRQKVLPQDHPSLAQSYNNVGLTYGNLGSHAAALEYLEKALEIHKKTLPQDHPSLSVSYDNMGSAYGRLGNHAAALEYHKKALEILKRALPHDHPHLATPYNNVGTAYVELGDYGTALEYHRKALDILEKALPHDHPTLAQACCNIAWTYRAAGQFQEAARYMRRAEQIISRSSLPQDHPDRIDFPDWADQFEKDARMQQAMMAMAAGTVTPPFALPLSPKPGPLPPPLPAGRKK